MKKHVSVRLVFAAAPTAVQLRGLRSVLPSLARVPIAELREQLPAWPVCVAGLSDVDGIAPVLVDAFRSATEHVHFVTQDPVQQRLLVSAGLSSQNVHASLAEARAACARSAAP